MFAVGIVGLHNSTPHGEAGKGKHSGECKKLAGTKVVQAAGWMIGFLDEWDEWGEYARALSICLPFSITPLLPSRCSAFRAQFIYPIIQCPDLGFEL
jgi:hypothetical protein